MDRLRYWLSAKFLTFGINIIPDPEVKKVMSFGLGVSYGLLTGKIQVMDADNGANLDPTIH